MRIKNGYVFTENNNFQYKNIRIKESRIHNIWDNSNTQTDDSDSLSDTIEYDASDCYVIPGLIDVHFHGCAGCDFCQGTPKAFHTIASYVLKNGITSIVPATMTLPEDQLKDILESAANYQPGAEPEATICGINLEGPFLSYAKKGAQNPAYLVNPDQGMLERLIEASNGLARLITIAPETEGALSLIEKYKDQIVFSLGHSEAGYDLAKKAFDLGATHVSHLYNAMPSFHHRDPGIIGAAFDSPNTYVELICDGIHIHPSVVRTTFKMFGDDRVVLISDSMMACGMPDGNYELGGQDVVLVGKKATLKDGTLAGSASNLMDCLRMSVTMGIPLESCVKAATINPAKSIGIDNDYGSISKGKYANLVILNKDLSIKDIIFQGKLITL